MLSLIFQLRKVIAMKKYNGKELYKGLLFIKSMMSMNNVNRQKELDQTYALSVGIECDQTVVAIVSPPPRLPPMSAVTLCSMLPLTLR